MIGPQGAEHGVRILVVEDDRALRQAVVTNLERAGFTVTSVSDGLSATETLAREAPDLVLLDLGLPVVDGWHVLSSLSGGRIPVLVISARGEERDKVRALDMGADDYLAKPFGTEELVARIRAVLRRARARDGAPRVVRLGDVLVDLRRHGVWRGDREVHLSPTEYVLLAELVRNAGQVMDHRTLLQRVWGPAYAGELSYLRAFIHRLRMKLEADPAQPAVVVTVGRQGYRFGPPLQAGAGGGLLQPDG